jgi:primary-amine oxidase
MPVENVNVLFKPQHFFTTNPSLDVPGTKDPASIPAFPANQDTATHGEHQHCCS